MEAAIESAILETLDTGLFPKHALFMMLETQAYALVQKFGPFVVALEADFAVGTKLDATAIVAATPGLPLGLALAMRGGGPAYKF